MEIKDFIENPPAGTEIVAFQLRQALAKHQQSMKQHEELMSQKAQLEAQCNADFGAVEALKACAAAHLEEIQKAVSEAMNEAPEVPENDANGIQ